MKKMAESGNSRRSALPTPGVGEMRRLEMLNEISRVMSATLDLRTLYESMYQQISRIMDTSMFFIALTGVDGDLVTIPYVREFGALSLDVEAPASQSVTNLVFEQGKPLLFHTDKQYEEFALTHGLPVIALGDESQGEGEGKIYVPLNTGSRTIGTLSVQSTRRFAYSQDDLDTLAVIASQAAIAIENGRLYEASQASARRLHSQLRVAEMVNSSLDIKMVLDAILQGVLEVMPCHLAAILLPKYDEEVLDTVGVLGQIAKEREHGFKVPFGQGVTGKVFATGQPLNISNVLECEDYVVGSDDVRSEIAVPLRRSGSVLGVLNVERSETNGFSEDDVNILTLFASQAAIAIENARLYSSSLDSSKRLKTLVDVAQTANSILDLDGVLKAVLDGIADLVPYYLACIMLPDEKQEYFVTAGVAGAVDVASKSARLLRIDQGTTGSVFASGEARIVPDVSDCPEYIGTDEVRSVTVVPLKRGKDVIGVLDVERTEIDAFTRDDLDLLTLFASQAAIAIENARLFEGEQRRINELQAVQTIVEAMTSKHDTKSIATAIDGELKRLVDYDACRVFLLDSGSNTLNPVDFPGAHVPSGFPLAPTSLGDGIHGWVAQHRESVIVDDLVMDPRASESTRGLTAPISAVATPLIYEGTVLGVIILGKQGANAFDEDALRLLEIVATQTAIALDRCRLYEKLRLQALTDGLTGLFNRRYLVDRFTEEHSRARRSGHSISVLMLDVDDFKLFNDTYGHDCGDEVLRAMADLLRRELRTEDIIARHGGEEFCVVLPEIAVDGALAVAERIRSLIAGSRLTSELEVGAVRLSIGVATLEANDLGSQVITRADLAMYQAKRSGGDAVCVSSQDGYFMAAASQDRRRQRSIVRAALAGTA